MSLLVVTATNGFISKNAAGDSPVSIAATISSQNTNANMKLSKNERGRAFPESFGPFSISMSGKMLGAKSILCVGKFFIIWSQQQYHFDFLCPPFGPFPSVGNIKMIFFLFAARTTCSFTDIIFIKMFTLPDFEPIIFQNECTDNPGSFFRELMNT